jgi:hypothetical protein
MACSRRPPQRRLEAGPSPLRWEHEGGTQQLSPICAAATAADTGSERTALVPDLARVVCDRARRGIRVSRLQHAFQFRSA